MKAWDFVGLVDGEAFFLSRNDEVLISVDRETGEKQTWIGDNRGGMSDFAVIDDRLFGLHTSDDGYDRYIVWIDPEHELVETIMNPDIVNAYADWFA